MKLRNMIGMGALLLTAPALAAAVGLNSSAASPMATGPEAAALPPLVPTNQPSAVYPPSALPYHAEGNVTVCFTVESNGSVADVTVKDAKFWTMNGQQPAPQAQQTIEDSAINTVKEWQYMPRSFDGQPVNTPGNCQTIRYRVNPPRAQ
ncbi:MAG: hypothetical protein ACRES7_11955 [Gammaproteobacteria bacterium]